MKDNHKTNVLLRCCLGFLLVMVLTNTYAQSSTSLYVGQSTILSAPNPPSGAALNQTAWGCSNAAVSVEKYMTYGAKVTVKNYFTGSASVRCDYYYYWYDNYGYMHTNNATTYFTITCNPVNLSISPTYMQLDPGGGQQISYSYSPSNISPSPSIRFISNNTGVATVSSSGYVRAVGSGSTTITITNSAGPDATCNVTVRAIPPTGISLPSTATVKMRQATTLTPQLYPSNATTTISWRSSNPSVATVSNGVVSGVSEGETTITATTANGYSASCKVTCWKPVPTSVSVSKSEMRVALNATGQLTYSVQPSDAIYTATWSSDNEKIATVSQSGVITPKAVGTTTVRVTTDNGKVATCKVEVWKPVPTKINLSETDIRLQAYGTKKITYTVEPSNAMYTAEWLSSNEKVATVTQDGVIEAKGEGTAYVSLRTDNGVEASCKVTVPPQPKSVKVTPASVVLERYRQQQLEYEFTPKDARANFTWSSSNSSVATVGSDGLVTARYPGTATITLKTDNGKTATCNVTVSKPAYQLFIWDKQGFKSGYATATERPSIWINSRGQLGFWTTSSGTVYLDTAQVDRFTLERIWPEDPKDVEVEPEYVLPLGKSAIMPVELNPIDAKTTMEWFTSDASVVSVSANGTLRANKEGVATITVQTSNGLRSTGMVIVPHPQPTLYIYNKDGSSLGYRLAEHPDVRINENVFTLHTDRTTVLFDAEKVWKFTIEDGDEHDLVTDVPHAEERSELRPKYEDGTFIFEGYPQGEQVRIYDANGRMVKSYCVDDNGMLRFSTEGLPVGMYIVKTSSISYKIIKQ